MRVIPFIFTMLWSGYALAGGKEDVIQDAPSFVRRAIKTEWDAFPHAWMALQDLAQGSRRDFDESFEGFLQLDLADRFELDLFSWEMLFHIQQKALETGEAHSSILLSRSAWRHSVAALLMPGRDDATRQKIYKQARSLISRILDGSLRLRLDVYGL